MTLIEYCAEKIYDGFALARFSSKFDKEAVTMLLKAFPKRFMCYKGTTFIFLRLSDESYEELKAGVIDLTDPGVLLPLFEEDGDNIHILGVVSNSVKDMLFLCRYMKLKSLSWYTPDMRRFVKFERG